ncbi:hypothetical protein ACOMHN_020983 [Nucella lapillus]
MGILFGLVVFWNAFTVCENFRCWSSEYHFPQIEATEPCYGQALCRCSNTTANCSLTHGALTFVPYLGGRVYQVLNFSYNNVSSISKHFFVNASRDVRIIDLYYNGLRSISRDAFRSLTKLTTLLLGGTNFIGYREMPQLLMLPSLTNISFSCVQLPHPMPSHLFRGLEASKVIFFDLAWNFIGSVDISLFQPLKRLKQMVLWRNEIYKLKTAHLPSWEVFDLTSNRLYEFPRTCFDDDHSRSLFPKLETLLLTYNMISSIKGPVCLPKVTTLNLNFNKFEYLTTDTFSRRCFPSLRTLLIIEMENKIQNIERYFVNNSEVRTIKFILNNVDFTSDVVHEEAFGGCSRVEVLELNRNSFQDVSHQRLHRLLYPMRASLTYLSLAETQLSRIGPQTFAPFNLTKLSLYKNVLRSIPDGTFDHMKHLKTLILDHNSIATISEGAFSPQLRTGLDAIYLGGNPFHCSCDILWFQSWFRANIRHFQDYHHENYQCYNVHNMSLLHFTLSDQACVLGSDAAAFTISIVCVLITFILLFTILFRFRWHMRLCIYEVCRGRNRRRVHPRRMRYDVFVSYAEEDESWIKRELLPRLEGEWGLRLCIHQRDFIPGKHIVDNISDCVSESDRVLLVLSPFFARSEWCQFELRYCQACAMERDDVMVLVMMQGTDTRHLTGTMIAVLKTTTYLEWAEYQDARASFWGRLRLALEESETMSEAEA